MAVVFSSLQPRNGEGLSFYLHAMGGEWYFRVGPVRDPNQPRFWRLMVEPCGAPTAVEPRSHFVPFLAPTMISREQLIDRMREIREAPMHWLQEVENGDLTTWLNTIAAQPLPKKSMPEGLRKPQKET